MSASKENRIFYYDNLRFFLILTVVIGHFTETAASNSPAFESLFFWIYCFHMPLFIFLSGMFHKNNNIIPKVTRFIMIGALLNIGMFLEKLALGWDTNLSYYRIGGLPWYMFVLAGYTALSYLLRNMDKRSVLVFSIILGLFSGYDSTLGDTLFASRFIVYYPFFVLGNMTSPDKPIKVLEKKWIRMIGILITALWAAICIFKLDSVYILRPLISGRNPFGDELGKWAFLYRAVTYIVTIISGFGVMCLIPQRKIPVVTCFGSRTLQIYFWHYFIINILVYLQISNVLCTDTAGKLIWLLLAVLCTFIVGMRPFGFPTNQIVNASRYVKDYNGDKK